MLGAPKAESQSSTDGSFDNGGSKALTPTEIHISSNLIFLIGLLSTV
jgi:hypothetical protein